MAYLKVLAILTCYRSVTSAVNSVKHPAMFYQVKLLIGTWQMPYRNVTSSIFIQVLKVAIRNGKNGSRKWLA
ncbi:hypothetical protein DB032_09495 [Chromobacterium sp. Panama]|nr:hypothetical protein DB032_09495 [Chromobacterium sp. Panama]